jgi:hypothetical protein
VAVGVLAVVPPQADNNNVNVKAMKRKGISLFMVLLHNVHDRKKEPDFAFAQPGLPNPG